MAEYTYTIGPTQATGGTHPEYYSGQIRLKQTPNSANNTSLIEYWFEIWPNIESAWNYTLNNEVTVKIDETTVIDTPNIGTVSMTGKSLSNPLVLYHGTKTVPHNTDGSKTLKCEATYRQTNPNQTNMGKIYVNGTKALATTRSIAEISSCPNLTLNGSNSHTVGWAASQSGAYYQVVWKYGDTVLHTGPMLTGTGNAMSSTWPMVPVDIASYAPSGTSLTLTAVLNTYSTSSTSTLVGSDSENFTCTFDVTHMGPEIGDITLAYSNLQGNAFVGGKSSATATWTATPQAGATIASSTACYTIHNASTGAYVDIGGTSVSSGSPAALATLPNTVFMSSEAANICVKIVVTDSRGQSSTKYSNTFIAYRYLDPAIRMLSLERCDEEGNADPNGTYFNAYIAYSIASLGAQNEKHLGISYFYSSDRSYPEAWITPDVDDPTGYTQTTVIGPYELPTGSNEPVIAIAYAWDAYTASDKASKEARLRGGAVFIDGITNVNGDKLSVAFGKVSDAVDEAQFGWKIVAEGGFQVINDKGIATEKSIEVDPDEGIIFYEDDEPVLTISPSSFITTSEIEDIIDLIT